MRLASLESTQGQPIVALVDLDNENYWPVADLLPGFTGDMIDLIRQLTEQGAQLGAPSGPGLPLSQTRPLAPISKPRRNIFCVGKNYRDHVAEFARSGYDSSAKANETVPDAPIFFTKATTTVIGPGEPIPLHSDVTQQVDYEAELAVVIGRSGRHIAREDAPAHIFGYTIINDVSARDLQKQHRQWFLGKSLDGFCPMGPYLVTADEVDATNLTLRCWVNGQLRQQACSNQMIFDIPTLIAKLSAGITLLPGDVISTGTPAGVGLAMDPPRFLKSGDRVRIEIDTLGVLENPVV
ncbi:MAG TPA: FAA hydrolase family protein [Halothiobacillus sp.]|nr:FAA hydrolase family protein [Halothiobacillus sp.]